MEIVYEKPPVWHECLRLFPYIEGRGVVFAYGDKLYNPNNAYISDDLMAHEETHSRQQAQTLGGVKVWWKKYLSDVDFRLKQEIEAYQAQYQFLLATIGDRNRLNRELHRLAEDLSGDLYGGIITFTEAKHIIKNI